MTDIKGMPSNEELIDSLNKQIDENLTITQDWRQHEVRENFGVYSGAQWTLDGVEKQTANDLPFFSINQVSPVIKSIGGFERQNRLDLNYIPRKVNPSQEAYSDIMNDTVRYIEERSQAPYHQSKMFVDALICGIGATDTIINYDNNPDGEVIVERLFPAFLFWDSAAREDNLMDSNYVTRIKVVDQEIIKQQYGDQFDTGVYNTQLDARILEYFDNVITAKTLGVIYEHQWRQKEPFYRVENPFLQIEYSLYTPEVALLIEALKADYMRRFEFDPDVDSILIIEDSKDLTDLKEAMEPLGIEVVYARQYKFKYYRAIIAGGKVIEKSENYSQQGFSIKFMTGEFDELNQEYYGLLRFCKDPQRILNQTLTDYVNFLETSPKGGVEVEVDAVADIKAFIDTYSKAKHVTVYESGGLAKSRPKVTPPLPSGILELIQYTDQQIMKVCGVTPELMGMMQSKEMNSSFYRQQIRQALTTLAPYFDAKRAYMQQQARLYIDCVRVLADNAEGRLIKSVTDDSNAQYFPLVKSQLAAEYDVVIDEVPLTPDQNLETFQKLMELQGHLNSGQNPVNIMPLALQYAPLAPNVKNQVLEMMTPQPQPPDPLNEEFLMSEINSRNASAAHRQAEAEKTIAETQRVLAELLEKQKSLQYQDDREVADIGYTQARSLNQMSQAQERDVNALSKSLTNYL